MLKLIGTSILAIGCALIIYADVTMYNERTTKAIAQQISTVTTCTPHSADCEAGVWLSPPEVVERSTTLHPEHAIYIKFCARHHDPGFKGMAWSSEGELVMYCRRNVFSAYWKAL